MLKPKDEFSREDKENLISWIPHVGEWIWNVIRIDFTPYTDP